MIKPACLLLLFLFPGLIQSCKNEGEKNTNATQVNEKDTSLALSKQEAAVNPYATVDVSPMDMSYYPADYPKLKMSNSITTPPIARVIYSRPHLQGRQLFHEVLKYGEPWRLGANEATELDLYRDVTVQGKKLKAGRYILYCIPQPGKWTIIVNTNIDSWGLTIDSTKDIDRFEIPVQQTNRHLQYYTMVFEKINSGAELIMAWDNLEARLPVNF